VFPATPAAKANLGSYASSERAGRSASTVLSEKSSLIGYTSLRSAHTAIR